MIEIIILGIIQGITEFLPISSSGHLVIFKDILGLDTDNSIVIEIVLHFGTLLSILIFYKKEIKELIEGIIEKGHLSPVIGKIFSFDKANEAHKYIQDRKNFGKVLLDFMKFLYRLPSVFNGFIM